MHLKSIQIIFIMSLNEDYGVMVSNALEKNVVENRPKVEVSGYLYFTLVHKDHF